MDTLHLSSFAKSRVEYVIEPKSFEIFREFLIASRTRFNYFFPSPDQIEQMTAELHRLRSEAQRQTDSLRQTIVDLELRLAEKESELQVHTRFYRLSTAISLRLHLHRILWDRLYCVTPELLGNSMGLIAFDFV